MFRGSTRFAQFRQADLGGVLAQSYLDAVTVQYAEEPAGTDILVNAGCPGYVATDLTGHQGHRTPEQGAAVFLELATLPVGGPSGPLSDEAGIQPW